MSFLLDNIFSFILRNLTMAVSHRWRQTRQIKSKIRWSYVQQLKLSGHDAEAREYLSAVRAENRRHNAFLLRIARLF